MPVTVFGLPTHILILHLAVVGIPTACLVTIAIAVRPKWRRKVGLWVAALDVVMVGVTYLTMLAGEAFFNHDKFLQTNALVLKHESLGKTLVYFVAAVAVFAILLALQGRSRGAVAADGAGAGPGAAKSGGFTENHVVTVAISALAIAASAICLVQVYRVGDSGAHAAWNGTPITSSAQQLSSIK